MQQINYPARRAGPEAYRTFGIVNPAETHWKPATCAEVDCANDRNGFIVTCDLRTAAGVRQARYVRDTVGRPYVHVFSEGDKVITFTFPAGRCFVVHKLPLGRPALFVVRNGDHRGSGRRPADRQVFDQPSHWAETFAEHQDRLATAAQRG